MGFRTHDPNLGKVVLHLPARPGCVGVRRQDRSRGGVTPRTAQLVRRIRSLYVLNPRRVLS